MSTDPTIKLDTANTNAPGESIIATNMRRAWLIEINERDEDWNINSTYSSVAVAHDETTAPIVAGETARHWSCVHEDDWIPAADDDEECPEDAICFAEWNDISGWWNPARETHASISDVREIPLAHYEVLKDYLPDVTCDSENEKARCHALAHELFEAAMDMPAG